MHKTIKVALLAAMILPAAPLLANEWNFEVYLDDKKVLSLIHI